jgi:hypothetical protein
MSNQVAKFQPRIHTDTHRLPRILSVSIREDPWLVFASYALAAMPFQMAIAKEVRDVA